MKFAAIIKGSMFVPGDERSRTDPGHGYGDSYQETTSFKEFANENEMHAWVTAQEKFKPESQYRLIQYEELMVTKSLKIEIKKVKV